MPIKAVITDSEGWLGMFTSSTDAPRHKGLAHLCLNCRPAWSGGPIVSRAGISGFDYGSPAGNTVLAIFSFYTATSTLITGRLVQDGAAGGAHLETFNWTTKVWTTRLTAAQIFAAGLDLTGVSYVDWVPYNKTIVFSDAVNVPWTWDGTSGAGIVKLTNAPVAYGKPTVYYGKLVLIKNSDRITIDWSEENAANTGYESGTYTNTWSLTQTGGQPLVGILGTNSGLYYWRQNSTGRITGAVTPNFSSTGVHDAVATTIGCGDYRSITRYGTDTWWMDNDGAFRYLPDGGQVVDVTPFALRSSQVGSVDPFGFENLGWIRPLPAGAGGAIQCLATSFLQGPGTGPGANTGQVWFSLQGGTDRQWVGVLVFDAAAHLAQGYFAFPTPLSQLATLYGPAASQVIAFSTPNTVSGAANYLWLFGLGPVGAAAGGADATYNGTAAIACTFMDGPTMVAPDVQTSYDRIDITAFVDSNQTTPAVVFNVQYVSSEVPTKSVSPAALTNQIPATGTITTYTESHFAYGIFTLARWIRPVVTWNMGTGNEAYGSGVQAVRVTGYPGVREPALV